jgi:phage gp36-like protein
MPTAYLTLAEFKVRSIMPNEQIDRIEQTLKPGWLEASFETVSRRIDAYAGKRYNVPFDAPPAQIKQAAADIVTADAYSVHGVPATDAQLELVSRKATEAWEWVKEVANGETGLIDLAPSDRLPGDGVKYGGTLAYSEASPFVHYDQQRERGREEDRSRRGTGGGRR